MTQRHPRRWLKRIAAILGMVVLVIAGLAAILLYPTFKPFPDADYPPAASLAERNLQDLDYLRHLPEVDRSFSAEARVAFDRALDDLVLRAAEMDRTALAVGAAHAVALADNGHTNVRELSGGHDFNGVPIRVGWFSDGLFVVAAVPEQRDLLGARIAAIGSRTPDQIVDALRHYIGGPVNLVRELSPNFLISPELLHAANLSASADKLEMELALRDGATARRTLTATPGVPDASSGNFWPRREISPMPDPDSNHADWVHVLDADAVPDYLSKPESIGWYRYLKDGSVLYLQLNAIRNREDYPLEDDLSAVLEEAQERQVKHAIVDLRLNSGGNYLLATDFSRRLPEIVPGKIAVLVSGNTLSAAMNVASRLRYYAGDRGMLIGEPMGDRGQFWGEGGSVTLPNSGISIRYTTAYHDLENGCGLSDVTRCFFLNYLYRVAPGPLTLAIVRAPSFAEYAAGEDPVLAEALKAFE